jgi:hypothetical protein
MTMNFETPVGSVAKIYFTSTPGKNIGDAVVLNGSAVIGSPTLSIYEVLSGIFVVDYIPATTGVHCVFADGNVIARLEVVQKTSQALLKNIEDEALGSWSWDKQQGNLVMIRQDGTELARFDVVETLEIASRERTT